MNESNYPIIIKMLVLGFLFGILPIINLIGIFTVLTLNDPEYPAKWGDDASNFHIGWFLGFVVCYGYLNIWNNS